MWKMSKIKYQLFACLCLFCFYTVVSEATEVKPKSSESDKICIADSAICLIRDVEIFEDEWDTLPQVVFWKKIMQMSPDSSIVNVASSRQMVCEIDNTGYFTCTSARKVEFKDSLRQENDLDSQERIYVTTGKNHFYQFSKALPSIQKAIPIFEKNGVDPWYAQAILLIECPGQLRKSSAGAQGHFQLMRKVAMKYGLVVNRYRDDRKNLEKSAYAAGRLINEICVPYAKKILEDHSIKYNEKDLFFRLLVLHVYHAGAGNVSQAVNVLNPEAGGIEFIKGLWKTSTGRFKNASQNYSQVALASLVILHESMEIDEVESVE
jgi:hypothetical protein